MFVHVRTVQQKHKLTECPEIRGLIMAQVEDKLRWKILWIAYNLFKDTKFKKNIRTLSKKN